jgi:hypothetical protein
MSTARLIADQDAQRAIDRGRALRESWACYVAWDFDREEWYIHCPPCGVRKGFPASTPRERGRVRELLLAKAEQHNKEKHSHAHTCHQE